MENYYNESIARLFKVIAELKTEKDCATFF